MPPGSSLQRTDEVLRQAQKVRARKSAAHVTVAFAGLDGATFDHRAQCRGDVRRAQPQETRASAEQVATNYDKSSPPLLPGAIIVVPAAAGTGIGTGGDIRIDHRRPKRGRLPSAGRLTLRMMMAANQAPGLQSVFTTFSTRTPASLRDIDRRTAEQLGVPVQTSFPRSARIWARLISTISFSRRTYRVTAQADAPYRNETGDIGLLKTRSASGSMFRSTR